MPIKIDDPLSPAEKLVMELIAKGLSTQRIAESLNLSPNTVSAHLRSVFLKYGVSSRTAAMSKYVHIS
jgi:DNA-binding CsgD family transcriptional regulator